MCSFILALPVSCNLISHYVDKKYCSIIRQSNRVHTSVTKVGFHFLSVEALKRRPDIRNKKNFGLMLIAFWTIRQMYTM